MNLIAYNEQLGMFPCTSIPDGSIDVTTITNMAEVCPGRIRTSWVSDWKKIRTAIINKAIEITGNPNITQWTPQEWDLFSDSDKYWLCQFLPNKINPAYMLSTLGSVEAISSACLYFDSNSKIARTMRWEACRLVALNNFSIHTIMYNIQHDVLCWSNDDWQGANLATNYILGYESQADDTRYGIIDYVNDFLPTSGYPVSCPTNPNKTMADVIAEFNAILVDGNY
jgi:hypothetical protein